jgi:hypothetical protein
MSLSVVGSGHTSALVESGCCQMCGLYTSVMLAGATRSDELR